MRLQARSLLQRGRVTEALALLDEVMAYVVVGDLSPLVTGYVFSQAIHSCIYVYALSRAREWSEAFARWCDSQPEMLAFSGTCSVLRAQVMQVSGAWLDAIEEAQRAFERCSLIGQCSTPTEWYRRADVHARGTGSDVARLRAASAAYELELSAARAVFEELGAAPDLAYVASLGTDHNSNFRSHGLTLREMQVLRRVAAGVTNRKIATELSLSEKTVDRHVSNIFAKLDVPSRTAATAYAYEHKLL